MSFVQTIYDMTTTLRYEVYHKKSKNPKVGRDLPCESRRVSGGGGGWLGSAGMGGSGRSMLAAAASGAGGGADGGPAPGSGGARSSGDGAELPDTELREAVLVMPGRHTAWNGI